MNRSVIYWKWDEETIRPDVLRAKIDDLCARTQIGSIFIGMEWIRESFFGEGISDAFRRGIAQMHALGRKAIIECCIRGEGDTFYAAYPDEPAHLVSLYRGEPGENTLTVPHEPVWHYWRKNGQNGEHKVFGVYAIDANGARRTLTAYSDELLPDKDGFTIRIGADGIGSDETLAALIGFEQPIPDLAHPMLIPYFRKMAAHAKTLGADGVFSDEWGYDVILKITKTNPYADTLELRHVSYSKAMEARYAARYGQSLKDVLPLLFLGREPGAAETVDRYLRLLREICTQNEEEMYAAVKEILGSDAFWGVHPTWWGHVDKQNFEFFKNGFYWWDAKRDIAQTDEMVIMPIRTALAHRFASPYWYNMWYSMGTRDVGTYYTETWNNLRNGGRTHYLGYECPNEDVVLELKPKGLLESIEQMDARIRLFDETVCQPDCRLLIVFGFEAVSNWALQGMDAPWTPENPRLIQVLDTANGLYDHMLCDLVPSYAADNGSLYVNADGKPQYGTQVYDAVLALYPERLSDAAERFLRAVDPAKLIVCGVSEPKRNAAETFSDIPPVNNLAAMLQHLGVPANRTENGRRLQDGSVIFTGDGTKPCHNPLTVCCTLGGKTVRFEGEDALWVSGDGTEAVYPEGTLTVNGKTVLSKR